MTRSARSSRKRLHNRKGLRPLVAVACALVSLSACSSNSTSDDDPKATPTPSATAAASKPADPDEAAEAEAIKAYTAYWREMERAYAAADVDASDLKNYASGVALVKTQVDTENMRKKGSSFSGGVTLTNSTVTQLDRSKKLPIAKVSSCLDVKKWVVLGKDKKPVALPSERLTKYVVAATLERWSDGWRVLTNQPQSGKPC